MALVTSSVNEAKEKINKHCTWIFEAKYFAAETRVNEYTEQLTAEKNPYKNNPSVN